MKEDNRKALVNAGFGLILGVMVFYGIKYYEKSTMLPSVESQPEQRAIVDEASLALCDQAPIAAEIGSLHYPINPKYQDSSVLAEIFTAYPCGEERVNKIFGVKDMTITGGLTLWLNDAPEPKLLSLLEDLHFRCDAATNPCTKWKNDQHSGNYISDIKVEGIMKLEPFHEQIQQSDCVFCG